MRILNLRQAPLGRHFFARYIINVLLAVSLTFPALAQEKKGVPLQLRLVSFHKSKDLPKLYYRGIDEGIHSIELSPNVNSKMISYLAGESREVVFSDAEEDGKVLAATRIPPDVQQAILFFLPTQSKAKAAGKYQILVIDESLKSLPPGGLIITNLASQTVRTRIGEFRYLLAPGKRVTTKRPETRNEYNMAPFTIERKNGESWKFLRETMMRFSETERYFVFLYNKGESLTSKIYKQNTPVPAKPPKKNP